MKNIKKHLFIVTLLLLSSFFNATTIPFELIDGKIIVGINIKKNKHNFIFDSGAFTIISSELKDKLNEKKSNIVFEGIDANNSKSSMDVFTTNSLKLSDFDFKNVNFSFADISWMDARACKKISGILGANIMEGKVWQIDFKNKTIAVFDKPQESFSTNSIIIPFSEEKFTSVPKINVNIRDQNIEYIFDTGSSMGFTLEQKTYNLIKDNDFLTFEGLLSQSINSITKGEMSLDLMKVKINNIDLGDQIIDSSVDDRNLLGSKFMENYLVQMDFINNKIILTSNGSTPRYKTFGISLAPMKDNLVIVNKLQIPSLSELNLSEKIIKINGIDISKINNETFCEVKKILDNNETITIENESHKKITLEKKNILQYLN